MNTIDEIQSEVTKNTINMLLLPLNIHIEVLDEVKIYLPKLVEQLLDDKIDGIKDIPININTNSIFAKRKLDVCLEENFKTLKAYLITKSKDFNSIEFPSTNKTMLALTELLINKFFIINTKKELVNLISNILHDFQPVIPIKDMGKSWILGIPFIALLSKASNGSIQFEDKGDSKLNYHYIKESCNALNIPFVLTEKSISNNPDEYSNCIQATIILKSLNCFETQTKSSNENNEKRFNEKVAEYLKAVQDANELIEKEENQINKFKICNSSDDANQLKNFIHNFNKVDIQKCRDLIINAKSLFDSIQRLSSIYKVQIPSNLVNVNEIKQRLDNLIEYVQTRKTCLDEEIEKMKNIEDEISKINTLDKARDLYYKLKNDFDLENWRRFNSNTFIYALGDKLDKYENMIKNLLKEYDQSSSSLNTSIDLVLKKINGNIDDLNEINDDIKQLDSIFVSVQKIFHDIKVIEPTNEIKMPDFLAQIDDVKMIFSEREQSKLKREIELEFNDIKIKCEKIDAEIKKFDKYKNYYSKDLCKIARSEHELNLPISSKYEKLFQSLKNDQDFKFKKDDAIKLINNARQKIDDAFEILKEREKESEIIESSSFLAMTKSKALNTRIEEILISQLIEIHKIIKEAQSKKKWDENAEGDSIQKYNQRMNKAYEIITDAENIINARIDHKLNIIKEFIDSDISLNVTSDSYYHTLLFQIDQNTEIMKPLYEKEEKLNLQRKNELDEITEKLKIKKEKIEKLISDFPQKTIKIINEQIEKINSIINEQSKMMDELIYDNSHINELSIKYLEDKASYFTSKYNEICLYESIRSVNYELKSDINAPDTKEILQLLHDLYIIYKSTLLLKPKTCSSNLPERIEKCSNQELSLAMAYLYVNIFNNNNKCGFQFEESVNEVQNYIMEIVQSKIHLPNVISKLILNSVYNSNAIELNALLNFKPLLPYFIHDLKEYFILASKRYEDYENLCYNLNHLSNFKSKDSSNVTLYHDLEDFLKVKYEAPMNIVATKKFAKIKINNQTYESWDDVRTIIADIGSYSCKAGYGGDKVPKKVIQTICNKTFESNLKNIYKSLNDYSTNLPILICDQLQGQDQLKHTEILFETFNVPAASLYSSAVLSALSTGRKTGIVLDIGHENTQIVPIYNGYNIPHASMNVNFGGKNISSYLYSTLLQNNHSFYFPLYLKEIDKIKENYGYVAFDFDEEVKNSQDKAGHSISYTFYDEKTIMIKNERYKSTEILFKPNLENLTINSVDKMIFDSIMKCDIDIHKDLFSNIILSGGTTKFDGFPERLEKEIKKFDVTDCPVNVVAQSDREYGAWIGGSIFASMDEFPLYAISRYEYNEVGARIVNYRCL